MCIQSTNNLLHYVLPWTISTILISVILHFGYNHNNIAFILNWTKNVRHFGLMMFPLPQNWDLCNDERTLLSTMHKGCETFYMKCNIAKGQIAIQRKLVYMYVKLFIEFRANKFSAKPRTTFMGWYFRFKQTLRRYIIRFYGELGV